MQATATLQTARELTEPIYFGVLSIPWQVEAGVDYEEWCSVIGAVQDGEVAVTSEDLGPIIELFVALKRQGVRFWPCLEDSLGSLVVEYAKGPWGGRAQ